MKKLIPFRMSPKSWGLKGMDYELAELKYNNPDATSEDEEAIITKFQKADATEKGEPYVNVVRMGVNPDNVVQGYFELDWNDEFVKMLQAAGITGTSDEDIVNKWFNGICRTVLLNEERDLDYGMQQEQPDVIKVSNKKDGKRKSGQKNKD